jgi:magnesium transporter
VLDKVEEAIEEIEKNILNSPDTNVKACIHNLKKELLIIRKSISPLREAISRFTKSEHEFIDEGTMLYVRDLYDHTIQVMDMAENYRDMLNGLQDLYISEISFKMNQIMQVLTVVTTIFVPLSFLTGLYGMNFEYIPELKYQNGYFILWGAMLFISVGLLYYFKRQNWF